jgi:glutamate racemase
MVDCFETMVQMEADRLANRKVLIIGTRFTASQRLYPDLLRVALPGVRTDAVAATALERAIARFESWNSADDTVLTDELRRAIGDADVVVLACTCFPMVTADLESLFPGVIFLDPGAYCAGPVQASAAAQDRKLHIKITGEVVSAARAANFAKSYLGKGDIECCT